MALRGFINFTDITSTGAQDILNVSGKGIVNNIALRFATTTAGYLIFTIDGGSPETIDISSLALVGMGTATAPVIADFLTVAVNDITGPNFEYVVQLKANLPFQTSMLIQVDLTGGGGTEQSLVTGALEV